MTEIRCNNCNELNDVNAIKCEACKASLATPTESPCDNDELDECERDFRFIEEAESIGQVYKLENLDELEKHAQALKLKIGLDERKCCRIPGSAVETIVKLEDKDTNDNETNETVSVLPIPGNRIEKKATDGNDNSKEENRVKLRVKVKKLNENKKATLIEEQYKCTHCPKSFKRQASLRAHINRIHNPDDCGGCCTGQQGSHHIESKSNNLESKKKKVEGISSLIHKAKQCMNPLGKRKRKFKLESTVYCENINSHKTLPTKKCRSEVNPCSNSKENKLNGIVYKCAACEKITNSYKEHLKHIVIHEKIDDSLTVKTSLEKLKQTPSGFLQCEECEAVFMSEREYKIHQRSHEGVHQCDICKTILLTPSSLRKHKQRMHRQKPTRKTTLFECNICNEKYESQLLMLQHRKQHTEVMKKIEEMTIIDRSGQKVAYVCKICAKTSNNKFRHEEHLRTHTGEKPYKCEKCGIAIATSNAMAHHMRTHENITFDCNVCNASYRHKKSLKKHLILHTGERPFGCRHCDKTFAFNYTRADHERKIHIDRALNRKRKTKSTRKTVVTNGDGIKTRNKSQSQSTPTEATGKDLVSNSPSQVIGKT